MRKNCKIKFVFLTYLSLINYASVFTLDNWWNVEETASQGSYLRKSLSY